MKVVILAGGYGTRISEETAVIPKPMVEIGGVPILIHIMRLYSAHGLDEFIVCCGYKAKVIKDYFFNHFHRNADFTIDLRNNDVSLHRTHAEPWRVTLVDTGERTMTGGRLKRIRPYIGDETFCMTYGDGVSDVDITALVRFHQQQAALATVTAVSQPGRFGALDLSGERPRVAGFREKSELDRTLINGGFFVLEPQALDFVDGDDTVWEQEPMRRLVAADQLAVYRHDGYWQNMDTLRDKQLLQELWDSGQAPWRVEPRARREDVALQHGSDRSHPAETAR